MVTSQLDPAYMTDREGPPSHPMDSSRILLSLLDLARQGEQVDQESPDSLDSVVARSVLRRLLAALHFRDVPTLMHSRRVALLSVGMAQQLAWESRHLRVLEVAALLHDLGKIGVPDNILHKPGKLSSDEAELISVYNNIGIDILQACRVDQEVIQIVSDSQAYYEAPDESRPLGSDVHLGARILAVADAYDSLTHTQVYREGKSHQAAMAVLGEDSGTKFDGNVVNALARWVEEDGLPFLMNQSHGEATAQAVASCDRDAAEDASALCHIFSHLYVLESLYDGFYLLDSELRFSLWNQGASELLGRTSSQMLGRTWSSRLIPTADDSGKPLSDHECSVRLVAESGRPACLKLQIQQKKGPWIEVELQSLPLKDSNGSVCGIAQIFHDASRSKRHAPQYRQLKLAATRDALTGVANRGEMEKHLRALFEEYDPRNNDPFSVIFFDIDHFKGVNDSHGHSVGDRVLVAVARLLQAELYSGELVSRYGGEEFVVLCPSTDVESAFRKAERLRTTLAETSIGEQPRLNVTASLGVSQVELDDTPDNLLHRADTALYNAKESGRNRTCCLSARDVIKKQDMEKELAIVSHGKLFRSSFKTCMMPEMVVYKVGGFVSETDAKVVKVREDRVDLQVGRRGLLGGWGGQQDRQPVDLVLEFGNPPEGSTNAASRRVLVDVTMTPVGRVSSSEVFQKRCKHVMEVLRGHFAAD